MTGTVELDQDGQNLLIRFPYREDLVAIVKDLPGRRWDPKGKVWRVPASHAEKVFTTFSRHLFSFAPEISSLLAGTLGGAAGAQLGARPDQAPAATGPTPDPVPAPALSISALNRRVRDGLREQFPNAMWIVGEIVDYDKNGDRQHRFFQLVERAKGQPRATATVEVALFGDTAERLLARLATGDAPLVLRDGIEIRALVRVDLYAAAGRFQVVVEDVDPSFTLGKLALTREQILRELVQSGLADRNRSLGFPVPSLRIGVLTSPESDGWNDFLRHLQESSVGFDVTLVPIRVQGSELKPSLIHGLHWFARHAHRFDAVCILRGGGSRTDLAWFDDRDIALAVARHPSKIVVGIGHQRDQSILDAIAHSEKTPTAVAELLVGQVVDARHHLATLRSHLVHAVRDRLRSQRVIVEQRAHELGRAAAVRLAWHRAEVASAAREIQTLARLRLQRERTLLQRRADGVAHGCRRTLDRASGGVERQATRLRLLDPARVLGRGYALVRSMDGRVLPSATRLSIGQAVRLDFRDGHAAARVDEVQPNQP